MIERCAAELRSELMVEGFPGLNSLHALVAHAGPELRIRCGSGDEPAFLRMRDGCRGVITLRAGECLDSHNPEHWEEVSHYWLVRGGWLRQGVAARCRADRLEMLNDARTEEWAGQLTRAWLLPRALFLEYCADLEHLADLSGCSPEWIEGRRRDLQR